MNFDITLQENHTYEAGDIYTNDQGVSWIIIFLHPIQTIQSGENGGDVINVKRACCHLPGSSNSTIKLPFDQTSDDFRAISFVNGAFELTTNSNKSSYCGLIFPAAKDENDNVTSVTGQLHRAYLLPLK